MWVDQSLPPEYVNDLSSGDIKRILTNNKAYLMSLKSGNTLDKCRYLDEIYNKNVRRKLHLTPNVGYYMNKIKESHILICESSECLRRCSIDDLMYINFVFKLAENCIVARSTLFGAVWDDHIILRYALKKHRYYIYCIMKETYPLGTYMEPFSERNLSMAVACRHYGIIYLLMKPNEESFLNKIRKSTIYDWNVIRVIRKFL